MDQKKSSFKVLVHKCINLNVAKSKTKQKTERNWKRSSSNFFKKWDSHLKIMHKIFNMQYICKTEKKKKNAH